MPTMYDDLWTGAKGAYKTEPVVADGGEVIIYAPHISEVSYVHGELIDRIGYHCRDYFLAQWDRFSRLPVGDPGAFDAREGARDLRCGNCDGDPAHPRHAGDVDTARAVRTDQPRVSGSGDDRSKDLGSTAVRSELVVHRAGEMLYRMAAGAGR